MGRAVVLTISTQQPRVSVAVSVVKVAPLLVGRGRRSAVLLLLVAVVGSVRASRDSSDVNVFISICSSTGSITLFSGKLVHVSVGIMVGIMRLDDKSVEGRVGRIGRATRVHHRPYNVGDVIELRGQVSGCAEWTLRLSPPSGWGSVDVSDVGSGRPGVPASVRAG